MRYGSYISAYPMRQARCHWKSQAERPPAALPLDLLWTCYGQPGSKKVSLSQKAPFSGSNLPTGGQNRPWWCQGRAEKKNATPKPCLHGPS